MVFQSSNVNEMLLCGSDISWGFRCKEHLAMYCDDGSFDRGWCPFRVGQDDGGDCKKLSGWRPAVSRCRNPSEKKGSQNLGRTHPDCVTKMSSPSSLVYALSRVHGGAKLVAGRLRCKAGRG